MGTIYINGSTPGYPSIAEVLQSTGLPVQLWPGWEWNTRSSGGFNKVMGIIAHHTASPPSTSFESDWSYCAQGHPDSPVANILLGRNGELGLHSGGASNHAGQGGPWHSSKGTIPLDSGNSNLIGIEASNSGVGEPWGEHQLNVYERICAAMCEAYDLKPETDIPSHALVGPGWTNRKIDPWGEAASGNFPYTGLRTWDMIGFTSRVRQRMNDSLPGDEVTDADIQKIAAAIWNSLLHNYVSNDAQEAQFILGFTHAEAYSGSFQREVINMITNEPALLQDMIRYAHLEAYNASTKLDQVLELLNRP